MTDDEFEQEILFDDDIYLYVKIKKILHKKTIKYILKVI